jgi:hypothetical protein
MRSNMWLGGTYVSLLHVGLKGHCLGHCFLPAPYKKD